MRLASWLRNLVHGATRSPAALSRRPARTALCLEQLEERAVPSASGDHDVLYVSDGGDNSVKAFDAQTGAFLGDEVAPGAGGLDGPTGILFRNPGQLVVVGQNPGLPINGNVLRYNANTGKFLDALVSSSDPNGTFAPRGIVIRDNVLYVADQQGAVSPDGRIEEYNVNNGKFLGALTAPVGFSGNFNPRGGLVFGPNGDLYAALFDIDNTLTGYVIRFDLASGTSAIIASNATVPDLHRPEGLVFGPNGDLYVTGFRADANDTDKILELNPTTGGLVSETNLDQVGQPRAFAQAILFGPGGQLFVPITGSGPDTGAVRSYNVATWAYTNLVPPNASGGALESGFYLTFGQTNPATLAYNTKPGSETSGGTSAATAAHNDSATTVNADLVWALLSDSTTGDTQTGHHKGQGAG